MQHYTEEARKLVDDVVKIIAGSLDNNTTDDPATIKETQESEATICYPFIAFPPHIFAKIKSSLLDVEEEIAGKRSQNYGGKYADSARHKAINRISTLQTDDPNSDNYYQNFQLNKKFAATLARRFDTTIRGTSIGAATTLRILLQVGLSISDPVSYAQRLSRQDYNQRQKEHLQEQKNKLKEYNNILKVDSFPDNPQEPAFAQIRLTVANWMASYSKGWKSPPPSSEDDDDTSEGNEKHNHIQPMPRTRRRRLRNIELEDVVALNTAFLDESFPLEFARMSMRVARKQRPESEEFDSDDDKVSFHFQPTMAQKRQPKRLKLIGCIIAVTVIVIVLAAVAGYLFGADVFGLNIQPAENDDSTTPPPANSPTTALATTDSTPITTLTQGIADIINSTVTALQSSAALTTTPPTLTTNTASTTTDTTSTTAATTVPAVVLTSASSTAAANPTTSIGVTASSTQTTIQAATTANEVTTSVTTASSNANLRGTTKTTAAAQTTAPQQASTADAIVTTRAPNTTALFTTSSSTSTSTTPCPPGSEWNPEAEDCIADFRFRRN